MSWWVSEYGLVWFDEERGQVGFEHWDTAEDDTETDAMTEPR